MLVELSLGSSQENYFHLSFQLFGGDMKTGEHEPFIRDCYDLARQAVQNGDHPFGALLVQDNEVLLKAVNTVNSSQDQTRHAEINLVSEASHLYDPVRLAQFILYTSTEPCAMCTGAIYQAGVTVIVFGCRAQALYDLVDNNLFIPSREILALGQRETMVIGPVLEEEGMQIHRRFWT